MLFWIAIGVVILFTIVVGIYFYNDWHGDWGEAFLNGFFALVTSSILMLTILGVIYTINYSASENDAKKEAEVYPLRSLGGDTIEGQYYLVGETIDEERFISFMYSIPDKKENEVIMDSVSVESVRVFIEEDKEPYMKIFETEKDLSWIVPWAYNEKKLSSIEFFVPENSILGDASLIKLNKEAKDW